DLQAAALADGVIAVLENDGLRVRYVAAESGAVRGREWSVGGSQIRRVYETGAGPGAKVQVAS
ncbi:alpha-(1-2)-phosphatidylinositol mannosyltransferase, partial [Pandoraea nosoerga]|nr:alpha-(1-2)-phosphatidylinositol mannosyltransferase [Pandoraea nosoerga]